MRKYFVLLTIGFQDALQYRVEGLIWFLFDVLPPLMMVFLWLAAYRDTDEVAGYSLGAMLSYYLGLALLRNAITPHPEWDIAEGIRNGKLSMLLVRPLHPWGYWLVGDSAWRILRIFMVTPVLLLALALLGDQVRFPALNPVTGTAVAVSLILAYALCWTIKICLGFAGFWLLDIMGLSTLIDVVVYLVGGTIVPLDLLPAPLRTIADGLPFKYIYYFPLSVALGRVHGSEVVGGLAIQAAWAVVMLLLARQLWSVGLRRYEAVGA